MSSSLPTGLVTYTQGVVTRNGSETVEEPRHNKPFDSENVSQETNFSGNGNFVNPDESSEFVDVNSSITQTIWDKALTEINETVPLTGLQEKTYNEAIVANVAKELHKTYDVNPEFVKWVAKMVINPFDALEPIKNDQTKMNKFGDLASMMLQLLSLYEYDISKDTAMQQVSTGVPKNYLADLIRSGFVRVKLTEDNLKAETYDNLLKAATIMQSQEFTFDVVPLPHNVLRNMAAYNGTIYQAYNQTKHFATTEAPDDPFPNKFLDAVITQQMCKYNTLYYLSTITKPGQDQKAADKLFDEWAAMAGDTSLKSEIKRTWANLYATTEENKKIIGKKNVIAFEDGIDRETSIKIPRAISFKNLISTCKDQGINCSALEEIGENRTFMDVVEKGTYNHKVAVLNFCSDADKTLTAKEQWQALAFFKLSQNPDNYLDSNEFDDLLSLWIGDWIKGEGLDKFQPDSWNPFGSEEWFSSTSKYFRDSSNKQYFGSPLVQETEGPFEGFRIADGYENSQFRIFNYFHDRFRRTVDFLGKSFTEPTQQYLETESDIVETFKKGWSPEKIKDWGRDKCQKVLNNAYAYAGLKPGDFKNKISIICNLINDPKKYKESASVMDYLTFIKYKDLIEVFTQAFSILSYIPYLIAGLKGAAKLLPDLAILKKANTVVDYGWNSVLQPLYLKISKTISKKSDENTKLSPKQKISDFESYEDLETFITLCLKDFTTDSKKTKFLDEFIEANKENVFEPFESDQEKLSMSDLELNLLIIEVGYFNAKGKLTFVENSGDNVEDIFNYNNIFRFEKPNVTFYKLRCIVLKNKILTKRQIFNALETGPANFNFPSFRFAREIKFLKEEFQKFLTPQNETIETPSENLEQVLRNRSPGKSTVKKRSKSPRRA